ncbi:nucleotide disphospho-sugar-binding domain-containing protein [Nucisporomicrobium flavum]|uniref:nucleotide disphospho-sugar-binding domain-containing protein n=1 Tax=Nucisporomicrobium flavum TaxID=2785915 RepID=UPI003C2D49B1
MRVLVVGVVPAHLMPMAPLAWALRAAGHEVLVSGSAGFVARAGLAGLSGVAVPDPPPHRPAATSADPAAGRAAHLMGWDAMVERWRHRVGAVAGPHLAVARDWRPDLILCDPIEFSGLIAGAVLGVPVVVHRWGADRVSSRSLPLAASALADIAERHGARDGIPAPALVLDPCPPTLQCPDADPAQPIRFVPFNGSGAVPEWALRPAPRRRVVVSFGAETSMLADPVLWDRFMLALTTVEGIEPVITSKPPPGAAVPPGVRAEGPVPITLLLDDAAALIHHGGSGTCLTAVHHGVPQLVLAHPNPSYAAHGERVAACGAGRELDLDGEHREPELIADVLRQVITDPGYRTATEGLRDEMHRQPDPFRTVRTLTELAGAPVTG